MDARYVHSGHRSRGAGGLLIEKEGWDVTKQELDWDNWKLKVNYFEPNIPSHLIYGELAETPPLYSIMIPTYRRANLLRQSIDSALNQNTLDSYEIVVVDNDFEIDSKTDALMKEYCSRFPNVCYYRNEKNLGMSGNWNRCIELCRSEWFCLLHDDDILKENYLVEVSKIAKQTDGGIIGVYKDILDERIDAAKKSTVEKSSGLSAFIDLFIRLRKKAPINFKFRDAAKMIFIPPMCNFIHVETAKMVGGYPKKFYPNDDAVFFVKMLYHSRAMYLPEKLFNYRILDNISLSNGICNAEVDHSVQLVTSVAKELLYSDRKIKCLADHAAIIEYNIFPEANRVLNIKKDVFEKHSVAWWRRNQLVQIFIMLKYYVGWGLLLFRQR